MVTINMAQWDGSNIVQDSVLLRMCLPITPPSIFPPIAAAVGDIKASGHTVFQEEAAKKVAIRRMIAETTCSEAVEHNNTRVFVDKEDHHSSSTTIDQSRTELSG